MQIIDQMLKKYDTETFEDKKNAIKEIIQENLEIPAKSIEELSTRALDVYNKAQDSLKNGNWSRYGELLNQLQNILEELNQLN